MPIIGEEISVFIGAIVAGMTVCAVYYVFVLFRWWIPHHIAVISIEDIIFWIWTTIYIFLKMNNTTYGSIRWYFILGIGCGVFFVIFVVNKCKKWLDKRKKTS